MPCFLGKGKWGSGSDRALVFAILLPNPLNPKAPQTLNPEPWVGAPLESASALVLGGRV